MKTNLITTILLIMFTYLQPAWGYSSIWNVDGWDVARLKDAGITITALKEDQIGEEPALKWVEISYDVSKLKKEQDVIMTLQVITDNGKTISSHRDERNKGETDKVKILFAVSQENTGNSSVTIIIPEFLSNALERHFGDPGFGGYTLSLNRIMQLASQENKIKPIDK